jgi:NitT/TauT family transport system substrate-binding protein
VWLATALDFKFNDIKDVKVQKVVTGLMPTTSTSLFIKLLKQNGMDAKTDVDMIQVAIGSEPGPCVAKQAHNAVMYEPGRDRAVAKGMKVVLGFPKLYGPYALYAVTARNDVDPDTAQRVVNGMEMAMRFMPRNEAKTIEIARKEFPTLDPAVVEAAVKRMIADGAYPPSVDITADALKVSMDTRIALGNLAAQPRLQGVRGEEIHRAGAGDEIDWTADRNWNGGHYYWFAGLAVIPQTRALKNR